MTEDRGDLDLTLQVEKLKKRVREAEGETSLVKAVGMNSPEMRALQARVKQLEETLSSAQEMNDAHQRYNGKLQTRLTEVEEDNKKLSGQISDYIKKHEDFIRRAGI